MGKLNVSSDLIFICALGLQSATSIAMEHNLPITNWIKNNEQQITGPNLFSPLETSATPHLTEDSGAWLNSHQVLPQEALQRHVKPEPYDMSHHAALINPDYEALRTMKAPTASHQWDHTSLYNQAVHPSFDGPDAHVEPFNFHPTFRVKTGGSEPSWSVDSAGPASGDLISDTNTAAGWPHQHIPFQSSEWLPGHTSTNPILIPSSPGDPPDLLSQDINQRGLDYFASHGLSVDKTPVAFGLAPTRRTYIDLTGHGATDIPEPPAYRLDQNSEWNPYETHPESHMSDSTPQHGGYVAKTNNMNMGILPHLNPTNNMHPGPSRNHWDAPLGFEESHGQYGRTLEPHHQNHLGPFKNRWQARRTSDLGPFKNRWEARWTSEESHGQHGGNLEQNGQNQWLANEIPQNGHQVAMDGARFGGHETVTEFLSPRFSTNDLGNQPLSSRSTNSVGHPWSSTASISKSHSESDSLREGAVAHGHPAALSDPHKEMTINADHEPHIKQPDLYSIARHKELSKSFKSFISRLHPELDLKKRKSKSFRVDRS